jgi:hypothetical protein
MLVRERKYSRFFTELQGLERTKYRKIICNFQELPQHVDFTGLRLQPSDHAAHKKPPTAAVPLSVASSRKVSMTSFT